MMPRPAYDAAELARSLLAELPEVERCELLTDQFMTIADLPALIAARNALTERTADIIAERLLDKLIEGNEG